MIFSFSSNDSHILAQLPPPRQILKYFCIQLSHKSEEIIIWCYDIEHFFIAFHALVSDHVTFIFTIVDPDWGHQSMTSRETIARWDIVHMERIETSWTVVACWTCRMESDLRPTVLTWEWFVPHREAHILNFTKSPILSSSDNDPNPSETVYTLYCEYSQL